MRYVQRIINKNAKNKSEKVKEIPFAIKKCETNDYDDAGDITNTKIIAHNKAKNLRLYCPDFSSLEQRKMKHEDLLLKGNVDSE